MLCETEYHYYIYILRHTDHLLGNDGEKIIKRPLLTSGVPTTAQ
jgi:hypothetical protein